MHLDVCLPWVLGPIARFKNDSVGLKTNFETFGSECVRELSFSCIMFSGGACSTMVSGQSFGLSDLEVLSKNELCRRNSGGGLCILNGNG